MFSDEFCQPQVMFLSLASCTYFRITPFKGVGGIKLVGSWRRKVVVGEYDQITLYKLKFFQIINKYYFKNKRYICGLMDCSRKLIY